MTISRTLLILILGITLTAQTLSGADRPALRLYAVSDEALPGWRYFSTTALPKVGYIANQPDFVIPRIKRVYIDQNLRSLTYVHADGIRETSEDRIPSLMVEILPEEGAALAEFTRKHIRQRVLIMLDDVPLFAPNIIEPIHESFMIPIDKLADANAVKADLEKMCE